MSWKIVKSAGGKFVLFSHLVNKHLGTVVCVLQGAWKLLACLEFSLLISFP